MTKIKKQAKAVKEASVNQEIVKSFEKIMATGYSTISYLEQELMKMNPTAEEIASNEQSERLAAMRYLGNCRAIVNNVIHNGHRFALNIFTPENTPFIENCIARQKLAMKAKFFGECECCPESKVDEDKAE